MKLTNFELLNTAAIAAGVSFGYWQASFPAGAFMLFMLFLLVWGVDDVCDRIIKH
jgi:hypothetical protein